MQLSPVPSTQVLSECHSETEAQLWVGPTKTPLEGSIVRWLTPQNCGAALLRKPDSPKRPLNTLGPSRLDGWAQVLGGWNPRGKFRTTD